jgi:hypothetical protein
MYNSGCYCAIYTLVPKYLTLNSVDIKILGLVLQHNCRVTNSKSCYVALNI